MVFEASGHVTIVILVSSLSTFGRNTMDGIIIAGCHSMANSISPSRWASSNIKSSVVISPRRVSPIPRYTACASLRPMRSSPSLDSGISCGAPDNMLLPQTGIGVTHGRYRKLKKVKKANGEIIGVNVVSTYPRCPMQPSRGRRTGMLTTIHCHRNICGAMRIFFSLSRFTKRNL